MNKDCSDPGTLKKLFALSATQAQEVADIMSNLTGTGREHYNRMDRINDLIGGFGVNALNMGEGWNVDAYWGDNIGIYVNRGDENTVTVLFDTKRNRFLLTTWGDFMGWAEDHKNEYKAG